MDPARAPEPDVDDLPTARALILTLQDQLTKSQRAIVALRHQLDVLCRRMFGKKSEKVDPQQLTLALEQLANEPGPVSEPIEMDSGDTPVRGHRRKRSTGRRPLPAHLPRRRVELEVAESEKQCACGHTKTRLGESVSEKLEYIPSSFVVIETARLKYACPACHEGVVAASAPPQAVERSLAGEGWLAHVIVSKYLDHLPLHRLEGIFARHGVDVSRATMCGWVADVATALAPIGERLRQEITATDYLQTDDTPVTVSTTAAAVSEAGSGRISIRWASRSSSTPRVRMSATAPSRSSPPSAVRSRLTRMRDTTSCIAGAASWNWDVGRMRGGASWRRS